MNNNKKWSVIFGLSLLILTKAGFSKNFSQHDSWQLLHNDFVKSPVVGEDQNFYIAALVKNTQDRGIYKHVLNNKNNLSWELVAKYPEVPNCRFTPLTDLNFAVAKNGDIYVLCYTATGGTKIFKFLSSSKEWSKYSEFLSHIGEIYYKDGTLFSANSGSTFAVLYIIDENGLHEVLSLRSASFAINPFVVNKDKILVVTRNIARTKLKVYELIPSQGQFRVVFEPEDGVNNMYISSSGNKIYYVLNRNTIIEYNLSTGQRNSYAYPGNDILLGGIFADKDLNGNEIVYAKGALYPNAANFSAIFSINVRDKITNVGGRIFDENGNPYTKGNFAFTVLLNGMIYVIPDDSKRLYMAKAI